MAASIADNVKRLAKGGVGRRRIGGGEGGRLSRRHATSVAADTAYARRSEVLRRAAQAWLAAVENVASNRQLRAAYRQHPEAGDAVVEVAARRTLEELGEW